MRLTQFQSDGTLGLTSDFNQEIPRYAILSLQWNTADQEVTFEDLTAGHGQTKKDYGKIKSCMQRAAIEGLQYLWVDTCCIDKSNSTELSKEVQSMFSYYQNATTCYFYLSDALMHNQICPRLQREHEVTSRETRWFTRGWTLQELQELLAPVVFESEPFPGAMKEKAQESLISRSGRGCVCLDSDISPDSVLIYDKTTTCSGLPSQGFDPRINVFLEWSSNIIALSTAASSVIMWSSSDNFQYSSSDSAKCLDQFTSTGSWQILDTFELVRICTKDMVLNLGGMQVLAMASFVLYTLSVIYLTTRRRHFWYRENLIFYAITLSATLGMLAEKRGQLFFSLLTRHIPLAVPMAEMTSLVLGIWWSSRCPHSAIRN